MVRDITAFGKAIKTALMDIGKDQNWLIGEVSAKTGLYFDSSYLNKVMRGKNENPNIVGAIAEILSIRNE